MGACDCDVDVDDIDAVEVSHPETGSVPALDLQTRQYKITIDNYHRPPRFQTAHHPAARNANIRIT